MNIRLINESLALLADIADSLRKLAGRPRLVYDAAGDAVELTPGDSSPKKEEEEKPPASMTVTTPAPPPAASPPKPESVKPKAAPATKPAARKAAK